MRSLLNGTFAISGPFFNGGPTFVTCKPVVLLIRQLFQRELGFATICALEFPYFVVVYHSI
jgi:hypothetical protein